MSCWNRRITALLAVLLICTLSACGQSQIPLDYGDETAFEADLNAGKNLVGKTVSFVAAELHPQSLYGYDIWAGEHLNFISSKNPDIEVGQTVTVKVTAVESVIGSWFIEYEKVDAAADENTIYAADVEDSDNADETEAPQPLEIAEAGYYVAPHQSGADTIRVNYCGMVHNPNETLAASYPKIIITITNPDGTIIATDSQTGSGVMPGDTVTLVSMMSVPTGLLTEETKSRHGHQLPTVIRDLQVTHKHSVGNGSFAEPFSNVLNSVLQTDATIPLLMIHEHGELLCFFL